jgi:cation diffusion facilitator family transporter
MKNGPREHYGQINRILLIVLVLNWLVAGAKIVYGLVTRCVSITADGLHSLSDGTSNIICLIGIWFACQPKDKEHPYGHKKYETLFSLIIAALLFIVAFNLFREGLKRLHTHELPVVDAGSFLVMIVTLGINIFVMSYESKKGRLLKSDILVSDAMHTKADIFTSISVIAALVAIKLGYPIVDPLATMAISLFIAYMGFEIVKESSRVLCDTAPIVDNNKIAVLVLAVKGVEACHRIRTRGRPDDIYLDLHVQVKPNMHIDAAHKISDEIEDTMRQNIPGIADVVVHMEPKGKHRD